jgi:PhnB protein
LRALTPRSQSSVQQYPPDKQDRVLNARLKSGVIDITATDWMHPVRKPSPGNMVALYISEAPYAQLKEYFEKLAEGADPDLLDKLVEMPFGSYRHLADKFGIHWFFQGEKPT